MLLKKIGARNYFVAMIILLAITIGLVIAAFITTAFLPGSLGRTPYEYEALSACEFEPWSFEIKNLEVTFPEGGVILTVNQTDQYRSVLLLGEGTYRHNEESAAADQAGGLFMVAGHDHFDEIRGDNIFIPIEDETLLNQVTEIADQQKGIPAIWKETMPVTFHAQEDLVYYYFITPEGEPSMPPAANYSIPTLLGSALVYTLLIAISGMTLTILSPDHRYSRYWMHLGKTPPALFSLALIPVVIAIILINGFVAHLYNLPEFYSAAGYAVILFILILSAIRGKIDYLDLGLRWDRILNGYLLAVTASVLIVSAVRGLPSGINIEGTNTILQLPLIFLLLALPREMIWRGYIQAFLSRRLGVTKGLLATVIMAAIVHFILLYNANPWMAAYPYAYLEIAIFVPGTAAILGYLYLRTENILACALMHSLLLWLPGILIY